MSGFAIRSNAVDDVLRGDLAVDGRAELDPVLQREGVGEPVVRDLARVGREVGDDLVALAGRRAPV